MTHCTTHPRPCRALSDLAEYQFEDRARITAVRKYCQVKPPVVHYERQQDNWSSANGTTDAEIQPDAALSALVKSLACDLEADLAMISLLDDQRQYFLAGAFRQSPGSAKAFSEATSWYGCDFVLHHGGLCERTIMMQDPSAVYEELDLAANNRTAQLPFVNGEVASFKSYAGCPVVAPDGSAIGTVFIFSEQTSEGLEQRQKDFLTDASRSVMKQLSQAVRALEGSRARLFNGAMTSLLDTDHTHMQKIQDDPYAAQTDPQRTGCKHPPLILDIYQQAARLLLDAFELDSCQFQEIGLPGQTGYSLGELEGLLAGSRRLPAQNNPAAQSCVVDERTVKHLTSHYPQGTVLHMTGRPGAELFVPASGGESPTLSEHANKALQEAFPDAQQVLFMPLWDTIQYRVVSVAFESSASFGRFYTAETDLPMLSAFCTSSIVQVRRVEGRALDRTKTDFLGSISHEMRSPLHGMLGSLELLTGTTLSDEQLDLIQSADASGRQLLDTIDKVLQYTRISALDSSAHYSAGSSVGADGRRDSYASVSSEIELLEYGERIVDEANYKAQTMGLLPPVTQSRSLTELQPLIITMDAWPEKTRVPLQNGSMFGIVLENLLTNSIKYSGSDSCLRAGLSTGAELLNLTITDCGRGIPRDFLSNHLFVPFSQVDHIEAGTGLGLPLVKRALDALGGTINVESNETLGTRVEVAIPLSSLTGDINASNLQADSQLRLEHIKLPLQAQLLVPPAWSSGIYGKRGDRLIDNLFSSLSVNLQGLLPTELRVWEPSSPAPSVVFVRYGDVEEFLGARDKAWTGVSVVIIGGAAHSDVPPVRLTKRFGGNPKHIVEISGPLLPSKIREALEKVFDAARSTMSMIDEIAALELEADMTPVDSKSDSQSESEGNFNSRTTIPTNTPQGNVHMTLPSPSLAMPSPQEGLQTTPNEPRLLLVDDNAVNLKLLHKFVQKCGIQNICLASGGSEALKMYDVAVREKRRFDICFMDLSMPDVDGFQATAEIRQREAKSDLPESHRLVVVAFTSLVSSKDQRAAIAAGVDGYVTKPANIKSVQDIISKWKRLNCPPEALP